MSERSLRMVYQLAVLALFILVAWVRFDLLTRWIQGCVDYAAQGYGALSQVLAANLSLLALMLFALWLIPKRARPLQDAMAALLAALAGFIVEAWGTRTGLWHYYTGEAPPLWIVPGWSLGALVVDRLSTWMHELLGKSFSTRTYQIGYGLMSVSFVLVFMAFAWPLTHPISLALILVLGFFLVSRPDCEKGAWILLAGGLCALAADLWGTYNRCWVYHTQENSWLLGIAFGMCFNSTVVLACLKGARFLAGGSPTR